MSIINKIQLIHLSNTAHIKKETQFSPKFWAKCAAVIASMATMQANADNSVVINADTTNALVIGQKLSTSNTSTPASLTLAGAGVKIIDNDNSVTDTGTPYANPFSGPAYLSAGVLAITNGGALGGGTNQLVLANGTTLHATTDTQAKANWASASASIKSSYNTADYSLSNPIQLGLSNGQGGAGADETNAAATITVDTGDTLTLTGLISQSANDAVLTVNGAGTLILDAAGITINTYSGGTVIGGSATLQINDQYAIPTTGSITLGAGTTFKSNYAASLANNVVLTGSATIDTATGTSSTFSGAISGAYTLTKNGAGTLALTGASGDLSTTGLNVSAGTLLLTGDKSGSATTLTASTGGTISISAANQLTAGTFTLAGGTFNSTADMSSAKDIVVSANSALNVANSTTFTSTGTLSGAGILTKSTGTGTLLLTGAAAKLTLAGINVSAGTLSLATGNKSTSATTLTASTGGTISIGDANQLTAGTFTLAGGTLQIPASVADAAIPTTVSAFNLTASSIIDALNGSTLTISKPIIDGADGKTLELKTTSTGSPASTIVISADNSAAQTVLKVSPNIKLKINAANNIPGAGVGSLSLNGGTLYPNALGITIARNVTVDAASTIDTTGNSLSIGGVITYISGLTVSGGNVLTLSATNTGVGGVTVGGTSTLKLTDAAAAGTGTITVGNGAALETAISGDAGTIANAIALSATVSNTATLTATNSVTLSGVLSGAADLTITGAGKTVTLSGTNTNTGKIILGGTATLKVGAATNLGSTSSITMGDGTTIHVTAGGFSLPALVL